MVCEYLQAMKMLKTGASAAEAVSRAIEVLEDSTLTNAGTGSSLTLQGTVECDASIMEGRHLTFGAVGALTGIKNPIRVAKKLVDEQLKGPLSLGRIPPCTMVGPGATTWAVEHGIMTVPKEHLMSELSQTTYESHKRRLQDAEERRQSKRLKHLNRTNEILEEVTVEPICEADNGVQDTVGAVCVDMKGHMAAGASSGGISLKQPGRLGPAAMFGAGCWAQDGEPGVAIATSGTGEHIMSTLLARECGRSLRNIPMATEALHSVFTKEFLDSEHLQNTEFKYGGALALKFEPFDDGRRCLELLWGHTTDSMSLGYMSDTSKPKAFISRLPPDKEAGKTFTLGGKVILL